MIKFDEHTLEWNNREFMLTHPKTCPYRGTSMDKRRTYHGYWVLYTALGNCGIKPASSVLEQIQAIQDRHEKTKCGFLHG